MKEKSLKMCIGFGVTLILVFPILAIISLIITDKGNEISVQTLKKEPVKEEVYQISKNDKAKVNLSTVMLNNDIEMIEDEKTPLALNTKNDKKTITGKKVLDDFKSHEKDIENGNVVFEVMLQNGQSMLFTTYDELSCHIDEKTKFEKNYLTINGKLVRYTYLELN